MSKGKKSSKTQNPKQMMQQLQMLQEQLLAAQEKLALETVTGTAGGGVVKITLTGDQHCTEVEIDVQLIAEGDIEMLQDLTLTALNNALESSRQLAAERLGPLTGGGLPF